MNIQGVEGTRITGNVASPRGLRVETHKRMTLERYLRIIAGAFVLISLALGYWISQYWFLFTVFVGLNLFQSGVTNWCPMMAILRKAGVHS
jgi:DUF2892 family protein